MSISFFKINFYWSTYACVLNCFSLVRLYDSMDYSLPGSSVHEVLQARILEWVGMTSSRGSFRPRDGT